MHAQCDGYVGGTGAAISNFCKNDWKPVLVCAIQSDDCENLKRRLQELRALTTAVVIIEKLLAMEIQEANPTAVDSRKTSWMRF